MSDTVLDLDDGPDIDLRDDRQDLTGTFADPRLVPGARLDPLNAGQRRLLLAAVTASSLLAVWYFSWLLDPAQVGTPWVYGLLVAAEMFNLVQAVGFWWTVASGARRPPATTPRRPVSVACDVLVPVYNETVDVVEPTIAAAVRLRGHDVRVHLLDDGDNPAMAALARRHGARYVTRSEHQGAKAGNINNALTGTDAPFIAVFDCDHVPDPEFLEATVPALEDDDRVAFVQTPQYYANRDASAVAAAAATQQDLFFNVISRGKASVGAMFCCGTNFVFRRAALERVGGFPENSLTEDFELSMGLHADGWTSRYVPEVLAQGLGPEDMASYVGQQGRWAQGCLSALFRVLRSRLPIGLRLQYLLSSLYFLSGWTIAVYMALPVLRIFAHVQAIRQVSADGFLIHFVPYFVSCLVVLAVSSGGRYSFSAFSLAEINFPIHLRATVRAVLRRQGRFVVTPKHGTEGRQMRPIRAGLAVIALLMATAVYALATNRSPGAFTNIAFALIHVGVLLGGAVPALRRFRRPTVATAEVEIAPVPELLVSPDPVLHTAAPTAARRPRRADRPLVAHNRRPVAGRPEAAR